MTHTLEFKDWVPPDRVRQRVEQSIADIERLVGQLAWSPVSLQAVVDQNATRTLYRVALTMHVPRRTLTAHEERHDVDEAVHEAFNELEREIIRHKERMRHEDEYKRPARREKARGAL
jgi:ribosomal subunit interface protein